MTTTISSIYVNSTGVNVTVGAGTIAGYPKNNYGAVFYNGAPNGLLQNYGTILGYYAVELGATHDVVSNHVGAYIAGTYSAGSKDRGVNMDGPNGTVWNAGRIKGLVEGIEVTGGQPATNAVITNISGGYIGGGADGGNAIYVQPNATGVTIVNAGRIVGNGVTYGAIAMWAGGVLSNQAGGYIGDPGGAYGVHVKNGAATITNAGTINQGVTLASYAANRVIVDAGAVFSGIVNGGGGTLELASGSTGTLNATSTSFTNFATTTLDSGGHWLIEAGANVGSGLGTIAGFTSTDTIQLSGTDVIASQATTVGGGVTLTHVTLSGNSPTTLTFLGAESFGVTTAGGVTNLTENTGPTLTAGGSVNFTGSGNGIITPVTLDSVSSITDSNNITSATVWVGAGRLSGDRLTYTSHAGITGSFSNGTLVLAGNTSAAVFQSVIDSITFSYSPSNADPTRAGTDISRTIDWVVTDSVGSSSVETSGVLVSESSVLDYSNTIQETGIVATSQTVNAGVMTLVNGVVVGHIAVGSTLGTGNFLLHTAGSNSYIVDDTALGVYNGGLSLEINPTTIGATGRVNNNITNGVAVTGPSGTNWTLVNQGVVSETASGGIGVSFASAGTISNASGGTISAAGKGIILGGGGTITNASGGVINVTGGIAITANAVATVVNAGSISGSSNGVVLLNGGSVTNQSGGTISGGTDAVSFASGFVNRVVFDPGATFIGAVNGGNTIGNGTISTLELASAATAGTLTGLGTQFINFAQITIDSSAQWTLSGSNSIASGETLTNAGTDTVDGTLVNDGVITGSAQAIVLGSGLITNQAGGIINGGGGFAVYGTGAGTLVNAGSILSSTENIYLTDGGTIINQSGGQIGGADGIRLFDGGTVSNQSGGTISAYRGISDRNGVVTVVNAGVIAGGTVNVDYGIYGGQGAMITNQSGGVITGYDAIRNVGNAFTLSNAGTITGNTASNGYGVLAQQGGSVTNLAGAVITGHDGVEIRGSAFTVANAGTIQGTAVGVSLTTGGTVSNLSGGLITGGQYAVKFNAGFTNRLVIAPSASFTGTVDGGNTIGAVSISTLELASGGGTGTLNSLGSQFTHFAQVTLDAGATWSIASGASGFATLTDAGTVTNGLTLGSGAMTVSNQSGGTIGGGSGYAIDGTSSAATVVNAGLISAASNIGILLYHGGTISNLSGGTIIGAGSPNYGYAAIVGDNAASTVTNAGVIDGTAVNGTGVLLHGGGVVSNQSGGTIESAYIGVHFSQQAATLVNAGIVSGNSAVAAGSGVSINAGGAVTNQSGGTIIGSDGIVAVGTAVAVVNAGSIGGNAASGYEGITLAAGGSVTNQSRGRITGGSGVLASGGAATVSNAGYIDGSYGVSLGAGGLVTNASGGTLIGSTGVYIGGGAGTVQNAGLIDGTAAGGITLAAGGSITNQSGGTISGSTYAVTLASGFTNRVVVDPGAVFVGTVDGGNTVGGSGSISTLELASGASAGTLSGLGTQFVDFQQVTIDSGAQWTLGNANTLLSGATLTDAGSLTVAGTMTNDGSIVVDPPLTITGTFINSGPISASSTETAVYVASGGVLTNTATGTIGGGTIGVSVTGGTLVDGGGISGSTDAVLFNSAAGNRLVLDPGATFSGNVAGGTSGATTMELAAGSGTIAGFGTSITNFTSLVFDNGAQWTVEGNDSANGLGTLGISGFTLGDTIDLTGFSAVSSTFSSNTLVLGNGSGGYETLHITGSFSTGQFHTLDVSGNTEVWLENIPSITAGATATFDGGGSPVVLDGSVVVSDQASTMLASATIDINTGFVSGDLLNFINTASIIGIYDAADGELVLNGTDSLADYQAALRSITYSFNPANDDPTNGGAATSRTIDWVVNDGTNPSAVSTSTLDVVHTPPTITVGGTVTFVGGGSAVTLDGTVGITDLDSGNYLSSGTVAIANFQAGDILNYTSLVGSGITVESNANGTLTLSGTSSITNYESALESITYSFSPTNGDPTAGTDPTTRTIDWTVSDGSSSNGVSNTGTSTLDEVHVAPTITAGATATFAGGGSAVTLDPTISITDIDSSGTLTGATVWINSGSLLAGDMLNYTSLVGLGITGSYDAADGTLTLTGTSSIANYESALESITYSFSPTNGDPTSGGSDTSRTIDWTVTDGSGSNGISNTGSSTLDVVHTAPSITAGGTATFDGGGSAVTLDATVSASDVDSSGELTGATIFINSGSFLAGDLLNYTSLTGLGITGSYNASTGTLTLSGTSSIANYDSALASITYSFNPSNGDPTGGGGDISRTIDWTVTDGSSSNGISNTASSTLDVVHTAPSIVAGGTATFDGGSTPVVLDATVAASDVDSSGTLTGATVWINSGSFLSGDLLNYTSLTGLGITGSYNASTGTLTLQGTSSIANYDSALASITYSFNPSDGNPTGSGSDTSRTIDWTVTDGSSSNGISNTGSSTLDTTHVAPAITAGATATFDGGGSAVVLDGSIAITDVDSFGTLVGATVVINSGSISGDILNYTSLNGLGITGSYNAATGTLTLSGTSSIANYESALDSVTYSFTPSDADPTAGGGHTSRSITWSVNDGVAISNVASSTLTDVHIAPSVTASGTVGYGIGGGPVLLDAGIVVTDPDSDDILSSATVSIAGGFLSGDALSVDGVTIGLVGATNITVSYDAGDGVLTLTGIDTLQNYEQVLKEVEYSSSASDPSEGGADPTRAITWVVTDTNSGNGVSNIGTTGLDFAQPPVITGTASGQATTDEAAIDPFSGVSVTDPNVGQTETITVRLSNDANGSFSDAVGGTVNNGTYVVTGSTLFVTEALDGLVFTPTAHEVAPGDTVTTTFTVTATDTAGASTRNTTTSVVATAVNDPPSITTTAVNSGVPNQNASNPFAALTIDDPDVGSHVGTLTVSLSPSEGGTLSVLSGGSFDATTGVFTLVGSIPALSTALEDLVFTPAPPSNGSYVSTTDFSVAVTDSGGNVINNTVTVTTVTQVLGLSGGGTDSISVSPNGTNFPPASGGATNEAIISSPTMGGAYSIPSGYQAAFLGGTANASLTDSTVSGALLVGNAGNDTISAGASNDTLTGGAGNNTFNASGTSDVIGVTGASTVNTSGHDDTVYADGSNLALSDSGTGDAIGLSSGQANVSLSGSGASVYANSGNLKLVDNGTGDAIGAYTGTIAATLGGAGTKVYGNTGPMSIDVASTASGIAIGTGNASASLTVGGGTTTVYGGPGTLTADVTGNGAMIGTDGPSTLTLSGSGATIYGGLGTLSVDAQGSGEVIGTGGNSSLTVSGSSAKIYAGAGSLTGYVSGNNALIGLDGPATLTLAGSGAEVFGGAGTASILDLGSGDTVGAGTGSTTITAHGSNLVVAGGGGNLQFLGGAGNATVYAGTGSTTVVGGSGATTLYGGAGGVITYLGGIGSAIYQAGPGSETFNGAAATAGLVLIGGVDTGGHDVLVAGSGNDSLFANTSSDTFTGGAGNNEFVFYKSVINGAAPNDVITDFNANDVAYLAGYGSGEASHDLGSAVSSGGNTTLTLSDNTRITFLGVSSASALQGHVVSF